MASLPTLDRDLRARMAALVQVELEARRIAISRELATIPPPVPACDADFNRLLDDRGRIADDLQRLNRLLADGDGVEAILGYCRSSTVLSDAAKRQIESLLESAQQH